MPDRPADRILDLGEMMPDLGSPRESEVDRVRRPGLTGAATGAKMGA
jgi:hypothetical protein